MLQEERFGKIIEYLKVNETAKIRDLAKLVCVSVDTIVFCHICAEILKYFIIHANTSLYSKYLLDTHSITSLFCNMYVIIL